MTVKPTLYWNPKIIEGFLIQAAMIHRRLPNIHIPGYHSLWPPTLQDEWERLYDTINGKPTLGPPLPPEVSYSEAVMDWLQYVEPTSRQLLWMRANRVPWKILIEEFSRSKPTLWREHTRCLENIGGHLQRIDPRGEDFRELRAKALATM
jgi:hypothetical protein